MPEFASRVVVVTGGGDGFGSAIVDRFHHESWKVIIIDINEAKGKAKAEDKPGLVFVGGDVTKLETWQDVLSLAVNQFGRLDAVVNNAGITFDPSPVHEKPMSQYNKIFDVNVKPIFLSAQVICPLMIKQGYGGFINLTSTGCTRPRPGFAFYNASKAAVNVATKTMALEYAPAIRFNCICPAVGETSMLQMSIGDDSGSAERQRQLENSFPMKRLTQPIDIANAAWFLGSDQSSFVTGTTIEVDGGRGNIIVRYQQLVSVHTTR